ncbi:MAG: outer membrane beta-barrel protein [Endomicrobium sp.]|jgi:hypothetical protein|nr:outer membrane beta-barrel protein [Endomicrobium sp.]
MRKFICLAFAICLSAFPAFAQDALEEDFESLEQSEAKEKKESELIVKIEVTPDGQINAKGNAGDRFFDGSAVYGDKAGLSFSSQYYYYFFKYLGAGAGLKYQMNRSFKNFGEFGAVDIYLSLKPKIKFRPESRPDDEAAYLLFQCGYALFTESFSLKDSQGKVASKTENGWYYAIGVGVEFNNIVVELLFAANDLNIKPDGSSAVDISATYSMTNINVGYRFGF